MYFACPVAPEDGTGACPVAPEDGTGVKFFEKDSEVYPVKPVCVFCLTGANLTGANNPINPTNTMLLFLNSHCFDLAFSFQL